MVITKSCKVRISYQLIFVCLSGVMEFPGYIIACLTLDRIGRRFPLAGLMLLGGVACLATTAVPRGVLIKIIVYESIISHGVNIAFYSKILQRIIMCNGLLKD